MEELNALKKQINLPLFRGLMGFIIDTIKADGSQQRILRSRCLIPFSCANGEDFQKKYGFLYLGELLERYEERFGMGRPDLRAIALALGYTSDLTPDDMFVGTQRVDFLKKVQKAADGDVYLTGALYLYYEGKSNVVTYETALAQMKLCSTEEVLFTVSLFPDIKESFLRYKPLLLRFLGKERSIAVMGNMSLFVWLLSRVRPLLKDIRTKDMALFRALCALPGSFIKKGDRHYELLTEVGYAPLEIAYANMKALWLAPDNERLSLHSVVTEKIVIRLFEEAMRAEDTLSDSFYEQLTEWFERYKKFSIKCYGWDTLLQALDNNMQIRNLRTFRWFSALAPFSHGAFRGFDVLDPRWDDLAGALEGDKYLALFEQFLNDNLTQEEIRARIFRYEQLTSQNYMDQGAGRSYWECFQLLVRKNVVDLWQTFQDSVDAAGTITRPKMIRHIRSALRNMETIQAFRFFEKFFPHYGFDGLKTYFDNEHLLRDSIASFSYHSGSSRSGSVKLEFKQEYLDDDMRRTLVYWILEYCFEKEVEFYPSLIAEILENEEVSTLFPYETLRPLFDLIVKNPAYVQGSMQALKRRYLTEEEQQRENEAQKAREQELEQQRRIALVDAVQKKFLNTLDGTMASLLTFLDGYKYESAKQETANTIVGNYLRSPVINHSMDDDECVCLLKLCARLVEKKELCFAEAQKLILAIKEGV